MARTLEQIDLEIAEITAAVTRVTTGAQSTTYSDGSSVSRANLDALRQMKKDLIEERREVELRQGWATNGRVRAVEIP